MAADFATFILQLIADNFWLLYSILMNIIMFFILLLIMMRLGPLTGQVLGISLGRLRRPAAILRFTNAQIATLQIREYAPVIKTDEKDPTSELVHMNRDHAYQASSKYRESHPGFFSRLLGKKQAATDRLNEVYSDDFVPVNINKKANSYLWGIPLFVTVEGVNSTINPMVQFTQREQVRAASIAVEQSLLANKLIAEDKFRKELATKKDIKTWGMLQLGVAGIGLLIVIIVLLGLQGTVNTFVQFVTDKWTEFQPIIEQIVRETPQIIQNTGGA